MKQSVRLFVLSGLLLLTTSSAVFALANNSLDYRRDWGKFARFERLSMIVYIDPTVPDEAMHLIPQCTDMVWHGRYPEGSHLAQCLAANITGFTLDSIGSGGNRFAGCGTEDSLRELKANEFVSRVIPNGHACLASVNYPCPDFSLMPECPDLPVVAPAIDVVPEVNLTPSPITLPPVAPVVGAIPESSASPIARLIHWLQKLFA